jgi:heptosyltransferase-2
VLGYPHIAQLALAGGLVDRMQPIEARGLAGFFARGSVLDPDWRDYFSEFDLIVSYLYDPDEIFKTNVCKCLVRQFIAGPHRPNEGESLHATRVYLKPLERLAIFEADPVPRLVLGSPSAGAAKQSGESPPHNQLAIHPGSGSEKKNWPEAQWAELIQRVMAMTDWNVLLVGGEAEGDRLRRLAASLPPARFSLAQSLPLVELAGRLRSASAFLGHDSGITHLAAALGVPCVVLWADTLEEIWRPQGERLVILKEVAGIRNITVDRVVKELPALISKSGCKRATPTS